MARDNWVRLLPEQWVFGVDGEPTNHAAYCWTAFFAVRPAIRRPFTIPVCDRGVGTWIAALGRKRPKGV